MVLRPTPRLADARPDREERRGLPAAQLFLLKIHSLPYLGFLGGGDFFFLCFFSTEKLNPVASDTIVRPLDRMGQ